MEIAGALIYLGDLDLAGNDVEENTRSGLERNGVKLEVPGGNYQARTSASDRVGPTHCKICLFAYGVRVHFLSY